MAQRIFTRYKQTTLTHILLYIKTQIKANKNTPFLPLFFVKFLYLEIFYMEPFGLFQLLQSILPSTAPTSDSANPPINDEKDEEIHSSSPVNEPVSPPYSAAQNAVLGFMDAHERRAKRLR